MNNYEVSREAQGDLFDIWRHIARTDAALAERIEAELYAAFEALAARPGMGHTRKDLTKHAVLFFPVYSYLIVYQSGPGPVRIVAVLRGTRNVKRVLKDRQ